MYSNYNINQLLKKKNSLVPTNLEKHVWFLQWPQSCVSSTLQNLIDKYTATYLMNGKTRQLNLQNYSSGAVPIYLISITSLVMGRYTKPDKIHLRFKSFSPISKTGVMLTTSKYFHCWITYAIQNSSLELGKYLMLIMGPPKSTHPFLQKH